MDSGILYIVATPIGNLGDISERAVSTLRAVDLILCEDTRVTKNLLDHFGISTRTLSYHQHSDAKKIKEIQLLLQSGKNIALVTDAGTPGISDPGNVLVQAVLKSDPATRIVPIPGASAIAAALSISGFPTDKFLFLGFPPHKSKRQKFFKEAAESQYTVAFYESGHRIKKCLLELKTFFSADREIMVCRELTKKFETVYRGTISSLMEQMQDDRGEFVVVIKV
jgi:16S rRNA (cytidine1402-2'-O)-methyltransferase